MFIFKNIVGKIIFNRVEYHLFADSWLVSYIASTNSCINNSLWHANFPVAIWTECYEHGGNQQFLTFFEIWLKLSNQNDVFKINPTTCPALKYITLGIFPFV